MHFDWLIDTHSRIDSKDTHAMHLRDLGDDQNEKYAAVDKDGKRFVIGVMTGDPSQERRNDHQELLCVCPRHAGVDLLVQSEVAVLALRGFIRTPFDPVKHDICQLNNKYNKISLS